MRDCLPSTHPGDVRAHVGCLRFMPLFTCKLPTHAVSRTQFEIRKGILSAKIVSTLLYHSVMNTGNPEEQNVVSS